MLGEKVQEPPGVRCSLFSRDNDCCDPTKRRYSMWGDVRWPFSVLRTKQDAVFYYPQQHSNNYTDYNILQLRI